MNNNCMTMKAAVVLAALALPTAASAEVECMTAKDATDTSGDYGRTISVAVGQGHGSIDCSAFIGYEHPMHEITGVALKGGWNDEGLVGTVGSPLRWEVTDPSIHADKIFVTNTGDGARCVHSIFDNGTAGFVGSGNKTTKISDITFCADDHTDAQPAPTPTPPIATDGSNDCGDNEDTSGFQTLIDNNPLFHGLVLFGPGVAEGNAGICTSKTLGQPEGGTDAKLKRCVNRCIKPGETPNVVYNTPFYADPKAYPACTTEGPFPIACRVCELHGDVQADPTSPSTPYCWEQVQKVDLDLGTFKKEPGSKGKQSIAIDRKHGSDCYLINMTTASGWPYAYWFPADTCPK